MLDTMNFIATVMGWLIIVFFGVGLLFEILHLCSKPKGLKPVKPPFFKQRHRCVDCSGILNEHRRMNSQGVCCHCGRISESNICDTFKTSEK
jgi:hypothetical protein